MVVEIETTGSWADNSIPIKTYPEQLEKDISNIITRCSIKNKTDPEHLYYIIGDLSILTIELMEYILSRK